MDNTGQLVTRLWNRNFSLVVICQSIVLLCNMTLSFALAYFVLDVSESATMFGLALGLPYISLLIMAPLGGIMADRLRKQRIMFWLDVSAVTAIVLYLIITGFVAVAIPFVIVKLLILNAIQGAYMPTIQAAVPCIVPENKLTAGNGAVASVNSLANLGGLALAGILYHRFGLFPIMIVCGILYVGTSIMDLCIRIPHQKQSSPDSVAKMVKSDLSEAARFIVREKPILAKFVIIIFLFQIAVMPPLMVGVPVLITQHLGMDFDMVGISQAIMMTGGLIGGVKAGALGARLTIGKTPWLLKLCTLFLLPIGLVFLFTLPPMAAFVIKTVTSVFVMLWQTILLVTLITFVQQETPIELRGKVLAALAILPIIASAVGQSFAGALFDRFAATPWIVVFACVALALIMALYAHRVVAERPRKSKEKIGGMSMKKIIFGSFMMLSGILGTAVLLVGSMIHNWTNYYGVFSFSWNLSRFGLMPALVIFIIIGAAGLLLGILGMLEKRED